MPRERKFTSEITKRRMNLGWHTPALAKKAGVSVSSIRKLENGNPVSRVIAKRYLDVFGWSLNEPEKLPNGWTIEDQGGNVVFSMQ